jgi:hypothetical protein
MNLIEIVISIDGKNHGARIWPIVPRVGEFVQILVSKKDDKFRWVEVVRVEYLFQRIEEFNSGKCLAKIHCKTIPQV